MVAFGQILPAAILEIPPQGVLNVHASLLPRWRGASPIQGALLAGDAVTGVTIMKLDEGMDTGPLLAQRETPVGPEETAGEIEARLARVGAQLLTEALPAYLAGALQPEPQSPEGVTVTRLIRKLQPAINWSQPAAVIHNQSALSLRNLEPSRFGASRVSRCCAAGCSILKQLRDGAAPEGEPGTFSCGTVCRV